MISLIDALAQHGIRALKWAIAAPFILVLMFWMLLFFPISFPAYLALENFYAHRYGSGIRPVNNANRAEVALRLMSWLACSTVAAIYMLIL